MIEYKKQRNPTKLIAGFLILPFYSADAATMLARTLYRIRLKCCGSLNMEKMSFGGRIILLNGVPIVLM